MNILGIYDWIFVGIYFILIAAISIWSMKKKKNTPTDYFLANRNLGWFVIGASILASNVGSEHIVGLAGTGAKSGLVMGHYELHSYIVLILGWVFVPFYMRSKVFTMPEFLERRYDEKSRWLLSIVQLLSYIIAKVSVTVFAGAVVFKSFLGVDFWTGAFVLIFITGIYTIFGGLRAVMYTEALQAIVLLLGSVVLTISGFIKIGGWNNIVNTVSPAHLNMFLPLNDPNFPWLGILIASPIVGTWYWCTDQHIVQRCLAGRDEQQARRGTIFAAFLKLLPFFIFLIPGLMAYAMQQKGLIHLTNYDDAFPVLVKELLPMGVRGLLAGSILAALMSSLASVYNACSTLFTMDIYKKIRPDATERQLVHVGRIATGVILVLGLLWIPAMKIISQGLYEYLQRVQGALAPPITAVFLLGVFSKRINAKAAFITLVVGFVIGLMRITLELFKSSLSGVMYTFADVNFLYFSIYLFVFAVAILIIISLLTEKPSEEQLAGLTYETTVHEDKMKSRASWNKTDVILTCIVLAIILGVLFYFSPLGIVK